MAGSRKNAKGSNHKRNGSRRAGARSSAKASAHSDGCSSASAILDYRLEKPSFTLRQVRDGKQVRYEIEGDLSAPVPPLRHSKYLSKEQLIEIYRWMLLNRQMETALENLYKQ